MKFARIGVLLSLFFNLSFAANLLSYDFTIQDDYVDIMLEFDEPFNDKIRQQNANGLTFLLFDNLNTNNASTNNLDSKILEAISILNADKSLQIQIKSANKLKIMVAKSTDALSMRARITNAALDFSAINTQENADLDNRYISVIVVLGVLCVILLIIKRAIVLKQKKLNEKPSTKNQKLSFDIPAQTQKKQENNEVDKANVKFDLDFGLDNANDVKILCQKSLDEQNKLMLLKYENRKYLVLVGNSNVMLDRFGEDKISNKNDFELFFEENKHKLNKYLASRQNSLNDYKNKLAVD